jgi:hypothetical protein
MIKIISAGASTSTILDLFDRILTGETSCCPDLEVLIGEDGNVLTGEA